MDAHRYAGVEMHRPRYRETCARFDRSGDTVPVWTAVVRGPDTRREAPDLVDARRRPADASPSPGPPGRLRLTRTASSDDARSARSGAVTGRVGPFRAPPRPAALPARSRRVNRRPAGERRPRPGQPGGRLSRDRERHGQRHGGRRRAQRSHDRSPRGRRLSPAGVAADGGVRPTLPAGRRFRPVEDPCGQPATLQTAGRRFRPATGRGGAPGRVPSEHARDVGVHSDHAWYGRVRASTICRPSRHRIIYDIRLFGR